MAEKLYIEALREGLREEMLRDEDVFIIGEDVGLYGGAFGVTKGLFQEFGENRIIDTPISEAAIAGAAVGAALCGMRPVAEIMFFDFFTIAMDQLVNQGAKNRYMFGGKAKVPMVIRGPMGCGTGAAAQHSQSFPAVFAHFPGLKVVMPATPYDVKGLIKSAIRDNNPVVFAEHKLLYWTKGEVPEEDYTIPLGKADIKRQGRDITLVAGSIMVPRSIEAANELEEDGIDVEVVDIRSLKPLDLQTVVSSVKKTGRVLIVEDDPISYGWGAEVAAGIAGSEAFDYLDAPIKRLAGLDIPIPYNPNLEKHAVPQVPDIIEGVKELLNERRIFMATIVKMPKLGTTMTEGTIVKWLKNEGDLVEQGEIYVEIQTDKVNIEDEAESSGILRKIIAKEGETVKVGEPIAIIARAHEELPDLEINDNISIQNQEKSSPVFQQQVDKIEAVKQTIPDKIKASPAAKRVARENQIDLSKITPSSPNERIVEKDVLSYIQEHKIKATPVAKKIATERQIDLKSLQKSPGQRITKQDLEEHPVIQDVDNTIPVTGMRKIIADSMTYSKKVAPHIYLSLEVDMSKVIDIREKLIPLVQDKYDVKLSYNHILIKAVATALRLNPLVNSSFIEEKIILKQNINIGLAVALEDGLIVPVIKDADKKGLGIIAKETAELILKAKNKKLLPDEYQGGTFTITNLGMFDIENFCAIINQPETAILAVGKIMKKPVVVDDEITIRPMMNLTLSCDHRAIDGAVGAKFLQNLKEILEEPMNLLL